MSEVSSRKALRLYERLKDAQEHVFFLLEIAAAVAAVGAVVTGVIAFIQGATWYEAAGATLFAFVILALAALTVAIVIREFAAESIPKRRVDHKRMMVPIIIGTVGALALILAVAIGYTRWRAMPGHEEAGAATVPDAGATQRIAELERVLAETKDQLARATAANVAVTTPYRNKLMERTRYLPRPDREGLSEELQIIRKILADGQRVAESSTQIAGSTRKDVEWFRMTGSFAEHMRRLLENTEPLRQMMMDFELGQKSGWHNYSEYANFILAEDGRSVQDIINNLLIATYGLVAQLERWSRVGEILDKQGLTNDQSQALITPAIDLFDQRQRVFSEWVRISNGQLVSISSALRDYSPK